MRVLISTARSCRGGVKNPNTRLCPPPPPSAQCPSDALGRRPSSEHGSARDPCPTIVVPDFNCSCAKSTVLPRPQSMYAGDSHPPIATDCLSCTVCLSPPESTLTATTIPRFFPPAGRSGPRGGASYNPPPPFNITRVILFWRVLLFRARYYFVRDIILTTSYSSSSCAAVLRPM